MEEEKKDILRFNKILHEEMGGSFALKPLALDPDFRLRYSDKKDTSVYIASEYLGCDKTAGIRMGEMIFGKSMAVNFGSVPPGPGYDFPILGFTFVLAERFLICVLDLHPLSKNTDYMEHYLSPLKSVSAKYQWIPKAEGGRSEVHDWAKAYDSGASFYRWCDGEYLPNVEQAFREYVGVFCACINKAAPINDPAALAAKEEYMKKYRYDYTYKDPGGNPLKHHFGEVWGERYMKEFLFAP
jgi:hypothetical protein